MEVSWPPQSEAPPAPLSSEYSFRPQWEAHGSEWEPFSRTHPGGPAGPDPLVPLRERGDSGGRAGRLFGARETGPAAKSPRAAHLPSPGQRRVPRVPSPSLGAGLPPSS